MTRTAGETDRTEIRLVLALWVAGLGAAAQFGKISVIFVPVSAIYPGPAAAYLVSLVGMVGIVLGTTAGVLVQRLGFRRVLITALALGAALSLFQSTLPPMPWMMASRLIEGVSHLAIVVAAPTLIAQVSAPRHQGMTMTLWSTFFALSFTLTAWGGLPLVDWGGPGTLFFAHGLYMAACTALLWAILPRGLVKGVAETLTFSGVIAQHATIYASPRIAAPALGFLFYAIIYIALLTLVPTFVSEGAHGFVAGAMPLASIATSLTVGVLALRWMSAVTVVCVGLTLSAGFVLAMWGAYGAEGPFIILCLCLAGSMGLVQGASFAVIAELNQSGGDRARAAGAMAQLGNLGTAAGTPILAAMIARAGMGGLVLFMVPLCAGGVAMHLWLARRRMRMA